MEEKIKRWTVARMAPEVLEFVQGKIEVAPLVRTVFLGINKVTDLRFQASIAAPVLLK